MTSRKLVIKDVNILRLITKVQEETKLRKLYLVPKGDEKARYSRKLRRPRTLRFLSILASLAILASLSLFIWNKAHEVTCLSPKQVQRLDGGITVELSDGCTFTRSGELEKQDYKTASTFKCPLGFVCIVYLIHIDVASNHIIKSEIVVNGHGQTMPLGISYLLMQNSNVCNVLLDEAQEHSRSHLNSAQEVQESLVKINYDHLAQNGVTPLVFGRFVWYMLGPRDPHCAKSIRYRTMAP